MAFPYHLENCTRSFNTFWKKLKQQIKPHISQLHSDVTVNILVYIFIQEVCYACYFMRLKPCWIYVAFFCYMGLWSAFYNEHYTLSISPSPYHLINHLFFLSQDGLAAVFPVPMVHSLIQQTRAVCLFGPDPVLGSQC